jgi:hypothetical protein
MLAPTQTSAPVWPITGDVADLRTIIKDQSDTMRAQEALIDAYQQILNTAQTPTAETDPATGTCTSTGTTSLTVAASFGTIQIGAHVTGNSVPVGTTITAQQTGTVGGDGVYTTNQATTLSSILCVFTPPENISSWPTPTDTGSLMLIVQDQTGIIRAQTGLLGLYQDLLNISETPAPT